MSTPSERSEPPQRPPSSRAMPVPPKVDTGMSVLDPRSKKLLDRARAAGQESVDVLALTSADNVRKLAEQFEELGATVDKADQRTGYLRAEIPIPAIRDAAHLPGVQSMQLAEPILRDDPTP